MQAVKRGTRKNESILSTEINESNLPKVVMKVMARSTCLLLLKSFSSSKASLEKSSCQQPTAELVVSYSQPLV
jgi:hypothetical protein